MKIQMAVILKFTGMNKYLPFPRQRVNPRDYAVKLQLDCYLSAILSPGC